MNYRPSETPTSGPKRDIDARRRQQLPNELMSYGRMGPIKVQSSHWHAGS
jgi:hypothetical protein